MRVFGLVVVHNHTSKLKLFVTNIITYTTARNCKKVSIMRIVGSALTRWSPRNAKKKNNKTKPMLIGTTQKLRCADMTGMSLILNDVKLEEAIGEKLLGIRINKYLIWNLHIDYVIIKLNCRINLLKRSKIFLSLLCWKLLYNSLIKPILEYRCKEQLDILLPLFYFTSFALKNTKKKTL